MQSGTHVVIHTSFEESDAADREYYLSLTPQQRLAILMELNEQLAAHTDGEAPGRVERAHRIIKPT